MPNVASGRFWSMKPHGSWHVLYDLLSLLGLYIGSFVLFIIAVNVVWTGIKLYSFQVPIGANFIAFYVASDHHQTIISPDGTNNLTIQVHDAGAAHSGDHVFWTIRDYGYGIRRVVKKGWVRTVHEEFVAIWDDENCCRIQFFGRLDGEENKECKFVYRFR